MPSDKTTILEVLVGVTMKTLSNYTNHIVDTPLDEQFAAFAWSGRAEASWPPGKLSQTTTAGRSC